MKPKVRKNGTARASIPRRGLAVLVALCLLLGQVNGGFMVAYATSGTPVSFNVGTGVTAELSDGVLTLSGTGDTDDFTAETAPFSGYAGEIHTLVIEEGVTYLGAHLFSGLGELGGTLTLPSSIVGFGDQAFSGGSAETSPHFSEINNLFESGEIVRSAQPEPAEAPAAEESAPASEDPAAQDASDAEAPAEEAEPAPEAPTSTDPGYTVEQVVQQTVVHSESLFFPGQTGTVTCSDANESFLGAALSAGYERPGASKPAAISEEAEEPQAEASTQAEEGVEVRTVYIDQTGGDDANDGTKKETAVKTLDKAANLLKPSDEGGTVENNRIVIVGKYSRSTEDREVQLFQNNPVPVTITGENPQVVFTSDVGNNTDYPLYLHEDFRFESIKLEKANHIFANGYALTIGDGVTTTSSLYLYGFNTNSVTKHSENASVTVKSGNIERIVGYIRSSTAVDCEDLPSHITVEGNANVHTIVAGSASGKISNANVTIDIEGGTVRDLLGGNQGYNINPSPFTGKSSININGGKVENLYGAGTGRNLSVPTFEGELNVKVTGGEVTKLYGAGSAAYVIGGSATKVNVSVSGGQVGSLFVAGKGWDSSLGKDAGGKEGPFVGNVKSDDFGSFSGEAAITIDGNATVGNIYASGEGVSGQNDSGTKSNAYLNGNATIQVNGGTVTGNIYGGGKGFADDGYEDCARVTENSDVQVIVAGGTVQGNVYGGGQIADVEGSTSVTLSGGTVMGNVYGGGEEGTVEGSTTVNVEGGTVEGSVFGGAYGEPGQNLVLRGSTVNMTGGWVRGNLYGGSELSNDGDNGSTSPDLVFTNLVGGTVGGNVFGGGYQGIVYGSTHLHIGVDALGKCKYYQSNADKKPSLSPSALSVGKSVYAGGDYGDGTDYDTITVKGTSHVYVDGSGYDTSDSASVLDPTMMLGGGVFGSGASCDAGETRLVTLENYGKQTTADDGTVTGATRTLDSIQRADRVLILSSHVQLAGQSDVANADKTARYSLNRIGDHEEVNDLGDLGNGLVLQGESTLVLDAPAMELAAFRSVDDKGNDTVADKPANTLLLDTGTLLRVSYTGGDGGAVYGPVKGYARLLAGNAADGYVYASIDGSSGGFIGSDNSEISFTDVKDVTPSYRYWKVTGSGNANATRETVLTARTLESDEVGFDAGGYSVAKGTIELPPAAKDSTYTVKNVEVSGSGLSLTDAAKNGQESGAVWNPAEKAADAKTAMLNSPLNTFGLFMKAGSGFEAASGDSGQTITSHVSKAEIGQKVSSDHVVPQLEFYLTYYNSGITASRDVGTVTVTLERRLSSGAMETTTVNVQIVTRTTSLSALEVDLYATQAGTYSGKLIIPSGSSRELALTGVTSGDAKLVAEGADLSGDAFSISMQPIKGNGWQSAGLMSSPCDIGAFTSGPVPIGSTDSRYEASIEFILKNAGNFTSKNAPDVVTLSLQEKDATGSVSVTLRIHWQESAVSKVQAGPGRQYNSLRSADNLEISLHSAMTVVFTLSDSGLQTKESWLELQNGKSEVVAFPADTEITLLSGGGFYRYTVTGTEDRGRIPLSAFNSLDGATPLPGKIEGEVSAVVDYGPVTSQLALGEYSLRMRSDASADSIGAAFTMNNSVATASISGDNGPSKGVHTFALSLSAGSDTRFQSGTAVVLSPGEGESFPEGTKFTYGGKSYYPSNGKVHIPLAGNGPWDIVMDTTASRGLAVGEHAISAQVFATGANAGQASPLSAAASYKVEENPSYGLSVSLDANANRIVKAGGSLSFTANYTTSTGGTISASAQKKEDGGYVDIESWPVSGDGALEVGSGTQTITVTVPNPLDPGTYRLLFKLGDQEIPYNLIVSE